MFCKFMNGVFCLTLCIKSSALKMEKKVSLDISMDFLWNHCHLMGFQGSLCDFKLGIFNFFFLHILWFNQAFDCIVIWQPPISLWELIIHSISISNCYQSSVLFLTLTLSNYFRCIYFSLLSVLENRVRALICVWLKNLFDFVTAIVFKTIYLF